MAIVVFLFGMLLPGCWLALVPRLQGWATSERCVLAFVVAPFVLYLQATGLYLAGLSVDLAWWVAQPINLIPVLWFARRGRTWREDPDHLPWRASDFLLPAFALGIVIAFLGFGFWEFDVRTIASGHCWLRADPVNSISAGKLFPEEHLLAGFSHAYPWGIAVQQSVFSRLLEWPHASNVLFYNLLWLTAVSYLAMRLAGEFMKSVSGRVAALVFLLLGVNVIGFWAGRIMPMDFGSLPSLWGDMRYTPWVIKFRNSTPMIAGLASCLALLRVLCFQSERERSGSEIVVAGALLLMTGVIYPILLPAAGAFVLARLIAGVLEHFRGRDDAGWREPKALVFILVLGLGLSFLHLAWLTQERAADGAVSFSALGTMARKAVVALIVMAVFLAGVGLSWRRMWKTKPRLSLTLLLAGAGAIALNVLFHIPGFRNEYKFIFAAAMPLSVFPAAAIAPWLERSRGRGAATVLVGTVLLALPLAWEPLFQKPVLLPYKLETLGERLILADSEPLAPVVHAVFESARSAERPVIVMEEWDLYWPGLVQAPMYVAPREEDYLLGTNIYTDLVLFEAGGYPADVVEERRQQVGELFRTQSSKDREECLLRILETGPAIVIGESVLRGDLRDWLISLNDSELLAESGGLFAVRVNSLSR